MVLDEAATADKEAADKRAAEEAAMKRATEERAAKEAAVKKATEERATKEATVKVKSVLFLSCRIEKLEVLQFKLDYRGDFLNAPTSCSVKCL
jgi:hypothetical protein